MRILIVEDQRDLASILKKGLQDEGYSADLSNEGEEGLYMALETPYDAIILDILLPKVDGLTLLKRLREKGVASPVLMLTARDTVSDKIKGLDTGADDYLTKPFEFAELLARLRALLRRKTAEKSATLNILDLEVDPARKEARRAGKLVSLTPKEYSLLEFLLYNKNRVLSRTEITEHIYDESFDLDSNVIDVFINSLRRKIDRGHSKRLIHTVRGMGYILRD